ncbi:MAG TPA: response regulator [Thermoplasmata archaeon]|nr:response regulator [Thermoplasmata archaeon]
MVELRYLIVDDSPTVRLTIKQALAQEKVDPSHVAEAGNGNDAIAMFDQTHPDVVFLDVTLSESAAPPVFDVLARPNSAPKSGNEVARYMRAKNPAVTIVVCTGNPGDDPRVREMIKGGAFQLLQKPVHLAQIRQVLLQVRDEKESGPAPP